MPRFRHLCSPLLAAALSGGSLRANDTAMHDGGSGPEPVGWTRGGESVIRMLREEVEVEMGPFESSVHCRFVFVNTRKDSPAVQLVGFPDITRSSTVGDVMGPLRGMRTFVDGREVPSERVGKRLAPDGSWTELDPDELARLDPFGEVTFQTWHVVKVSFPAGREVVIERRFRTDNGRTAGGPVFFRYTTETGGNWQGRIGHGRFTVRVAEGMQAARLVPEPAAGWQRSEDGRTFTLEWSDFEPRLDETRRGWSLGWLPTTGTPDDEGVKDRLRRAYAPAAD